MKAHVSENSFIWVKAESGNLIENHQVHGPPNAVSPRRQGQACKI